MNPGLANGLTIIGAVLVFAALTWYLRGRMTRAAREREAIALLQQRRGVIVVERFPATRTQGETWTATYYPHGTAPMHVAAVGSGLTEGGALRALAEAFGGSAP